MSYNNRITDKEIGLLKGAIRRVFSRSELRKEALSKSIIVGYKDPERPRVTKWSICNECKKKEPTYKIEVDHLNPVVPLDTLFKKMDLLEFINRVWCEIEYLQVICKPCHKVKTKSEAKIRRLNKKQNTIVDKKTKRK